MTTESILLRDLSTEWAKLSVHKEHGGFAAVEKALKMDSDAIIDEVKRASLRGRGGAGFPAGVKWGFVPKDSEKPKYLVVNADEGEPGTFKDRYFLGVDPYPLLEGCIICSYALNLNTCYIYVRGEFADEIQVLEDAIAQAYEAGYFGKNILGTGFDLECYVHPGAGAYICGEETALLNSLEGKAGQPRLKPPFPAVEGLFGCPTVINNVETLANVPHIIENGAEWFVSKGIEGEGGTRIVGVSGHVNKPGLYEVPVGVNMRSIIDDLCGGTLDGRKIVAVIPGGTSCPIMRPEELDVPVDIESLKAIGSMAGTGGMIVICEPTPLLEVMLRVSRFYAHESCGQCTPCREGTGWLVRILEKIHAGEGTRAEMDLLLDAANKIEGNTICALGEAAAWPVQSFVRKFPEEIERYLKEDVQVA